MTGDEKLARLLGDLASFVGQAAFITSHGRDAYVADDQQGMLLRNAGERVLIKVATVVERLPQAFKEAHPDVAWQDIGRMRNLVAHHNDHVDDDLMWNALVMRVPDLSRRVGPRPL